jgi:heme peroxidase
MAADPISAPSAYVLDETRLHVRTRLRLGRMARDEQIPGECPFRDIARIAPPNVVGPACEGLTDVLIADPRNDDHAIMSQLTTVFHLLHNAIVDRLPPPAQSARAVPIAAAYETFNCARAAVTLIYRNIIRKDLMRRILHPDVYDAYASDQPTFIDQAGLDAGGIPLEFSHGAFRFGHAMVRNKYRINDRATFDLVDVLGRNSTHEPVNMPLGKNWIVRWSHLFF